MTKLLTIAVLSSLLMTNLVSANTNKQNQESEQNKTKNKKQLTINKKVKSGVSPVKKEEVILLIDTFLYDSPLNKDEYTLATAKDYALLPIKPSAKTNLHYYKNSKYPNTLFLFKDNKLKGVAKFIEKSEKELSIDTILEHKSNESFVGGTVVFIKDDILQLRKVFRNLKALKKKYEALSKEVNENSILIATSIFKNKKGVRRLSIFAKEYKPTKECNSCEFVKASTPEISVNQEIIVMYFK